MRSLERLSVAVAVSAGLCGAALALSPDSGATPLRTGGGGCAAAAPVTPMVLPGPVAAAVPLAPVVPAAPVVPPVPLAPPVPVVPAAPIIPAAGAAAAPAEGVAAAPVTKAAGGKGAPTNPAPALAPAAEPVVLPGPAPQPTTPIPAVLTGSTTALPVCAGVN